MVSKKKMLKEGNEWALWTCAGPNKTDWESKEGGVRVLEWA